MVSSGYCGSCGNCFSTVCQLAKPTVESSRRRRKADRCLGRCKPEGVSGYCSEPGTFSVQGTMTVTVMVAAGGLPAD